MELDRSDKVAYMTMAEFNALLEYSTTLPTGQTEGKVWKRQSNIGACQRKPKTPPKWLLGEYGKVADGHIAIHWYDIAIEEHPNG